MRTKDRKPRSWIPDQVRDDGKWCPVEKSSMPDPRISPAMIRLYDRFTPQTLDRRALMAGLARLAGSTPAARDRKNVVAGKSVSVRVVLGGRRVHQQKQQKKQ